MARPAGRGVGRLPRDTKIIVGTATMHGTKRSQMSDGTEVVPGTFWRMTARPKLDSVPAGKVRFKGVAVSSASYSVKTGQPLTWYFGILVLSLIAGTVIAWLAWFFARLFLAAAIACAVGVIWSIVGIFQSTRTEWIFTPDGIDWRDAGLLKRRHRRIAVSDIAAVGVETRRSRSLPPLLNPVEPKVIRDSLTSDGKGRADRPADEQTTYRLAFRLQSGEVLKIDREQSREDFVRTLGHLAQIMPHVTWPVAA